MGLAIDGNEVHGIARGGQAFVSLGNTNNADGSINIGGQDYLSKIKMKIKGIYTFQMDINSNTINSTEVTSGLSNYEGYLAICVINDYESHPIIIPVDPSHSASFDTKTFNCSLSMINNDNYNRLQFYAQSTYVANGVNFGFYILSN